LTLSSASTAAPAYQSAPVSAIFALDDLPEKWHSYIEKNSNYVDGGKFQPDKYSTA
jgi:hypothetical protein